MDTEFAPIAFDGVNTAAEGLVLVADGAVVDEMLSAADLAKAQVTRRTLSPEDLAVLSVSLSETPPASLNTVKQ